MPNKPVPPPNNEQPQNRPTSPPPPRQRPSTEDRLREANLRIEELYLVIRLIKDTFGEKILHLQQENEKLRIENDGLNAKLHDCHTVLVRVK